MTAEKDNFKVSVIIPVYNVENFVERCIDSVLGQTMQGGVEVIIVNDCTPDGSMEKISESLRTYEQKEQAEKMTVRVVCHDTNRGQASARNTGIGYVTGDYVIHVDSDDWIDKDMFQKLYCKAVEEEADIVVCDYWAEYGSKSIRNYQEVNNREEFIRKQLKGKIHSGMWNKLVKRDLYDKLDFLWVDGVNMWEDVSLMCRIAYYAERISYVGEALYHYNQTNENAYTKVWKKSSLDNMVQATDIVCSFYRQKEAEFQSDIELLKLRAKSNLLFHSPAQDRCVYKNLYPEINKLIFSCPALFIYNKILMWCWCHSLYKPANTLQAIVLFVKRLVRR